MKVNDVVIRLGTVLALTLVIAGGAALIPRTLVPVDRASAQEAVAPSTPRYGAWGFDLTGVDRNAKPGDSFFDYADGAWVARTAIPPDRNRFGMFEALREQTQEQLHAIIEELAGSGAAPDSETGKIGALYRAFMDEARIEGLDAAPIADDLAKIRAAQSKDEIAALMGAARGGFGASFFFLNVSEDPKDPTHHVLAASQGGLGLPDRDYYLRDAFKDKKAKYRDYVARMLAMANWADARRARRRNRRARNPDRRGELEPRRKPRPGQDLQPDDTGRARRRRAGLPLGGVLDGGADSAMPGASWSGRTPPSPSSQPIFARDAARDAAGVAGVPRRRSGGAVSVQALRRRALRSSAATSCPASPKSRRAGSAARNWSSPPLGEALGQGIRRASLPAGVQGQDGGPGRPTARPRCGGASSSSHWMTPETKAKALEKLVAVRRQDRLPEQVARLFHAAGRTRPISSAMSAARAPSTGLTSCAQARQAGRSARNGA